MADPRPKVMIARLMPRARTAGIANSAPSGTVATRPAGSANRKGQPSAATSRPATNAPKPARPNWASESCPVYPVMTTTESNTSPSAKVVMKASCHWGDTIVIKRAVAASSAARTPGRTRPLPTVGRRCRK